MPVSLSGNRTEHSSDVFSLESRNYRLFFIYFSGKEEKRMERFTNILVSIDDVVWGVPLIILIMGTAYYSP
jgi:hypothetical protein